MHFVFKLRTLDQIYRRLCFSVLKDDSRVLKTCLISKAVAYIRVPVRRGIMNNSKIIFLISQKIYVVTPHQNCLAETVLMMGHNICFKGILWKISLNYPFYPFYLEHWFNY